MKKTFLRSVSWHRRGALLLAGLTFAAGAAAPAAAAQVRVSTLLQPPPPAEMPALSMKDNAIQLSIDQAIEIALQRNLQIVVQRYVRNQTQLTIAGALGYYDLNLTGSADIIDQRGPVINLSTFTSQGRSNDFGVGLDQNLPTGGSVSVGVDNSYTPFTRTAKGLPVDATYGTGISFTFDQPLLNAYGQLAAERNILVAQTNSLVSRGDFALQVTTITQAVVNAYWTLVNNREQLTVARESLQLARDLNDRNRIQVQVGTLAPLDITQSEAAIATRDEAIIQATSAVGDAEDTLRQLMNFPSGKLWETPIVPTSDPKTDEKVTAHVDEALRIAFEQRPELHSDLLHLQQAKVDAEYYRSLLKPTLGLHLQYGYKGTGLQFNNAFSQVTGLDFRSWQASLAFKYPLQNRVARAASASANIDVDRNAQLYEQEKKVVETEVRRATRGLDTAIKAIEAARIAREFQDKNLDAEKKRYENGMSTAFQITQIQDQLTQARSQEVTATVNYRTALAEYYRSIGRLLDQEGIVLDDPLAPDYRTQRFSFRRGLLPGEARR
jgi:outer membrane protein TolC